MKCLLIFLIIKDFKKNKEILKYKVYYNIINKYFMLIIN